MILSAATVVTGADDRVGPGWVEITGARITAVGTGRAARAAHDLGDAVLVPGFVDLHVHGGGGAAFGADVDQAARAIAFHRAHGTTTMLASLVSDGPAALRRAVAALGALVTDGELAGVHLEGPWLAATRCGAHDPRHLRDPDPAELDSLLATGAVRMVTLAPERRGALDAVRRITAAGALAAIGHTDADHARTREAIDAGARVATHLFNAMRPIHHREPGPALALLADPRVTVELVLDGRHVHPALGDHVIDTAGTHRVAAVTDAMAAAGMADGRYRLGSLDVEVSDRTARLAGTDTLAGSTATTATLFAAVVEGTALPRPDALRRAVALTATTPARTLGRTDIGVLAPGRRADLVVLDPDLRIREVRRAGRVVAPARASSPAAAPGS